MVFIASPIELPRFTSIHIGRANHTEEYVDLLMIVIGAPTTNKKELSTTHIGLRSCRLGHLSTPKSS